MGGGWKVVKFYNGRGTAEQWIKEGKYAVKWTRLSCRNFRDNQVRLQLFALAYNLGNFLRRLALPRSVKHWSLTTLREKLIKTGAKVVRHSKYVTFQMAEVAVARGLFAAILERIQRFGVPPPLAQRANATTERNVGDSCGAEVASARKQLVPMPLDLGHHAAGMVPTLSLIREARVEHLGLV